MKAAHAIVLRQEFFAWRGALEDADFRRFLDAHDACLLAKSPRRSVEVFTWQGKRYFFKWHHAAEGRGLGLREWEATIRAGSLGIPVPKAAAAGDSFFISEALPGAISLEDWLEAESTRRTRIPRPLIQDAAAIAAALHKARMAHKDLYLGHFFYDAETGTVSLIDLARVQEHRWFFPRWRVKDLAALLFSSSLLNVAPRDKISFFHAYLGRNKLRTGDRKLALRVQRKARRIARHTARTLRKSPGGELRQATPHNALDRVVGIS